MGRGEEGGKDMKGNAQYIRRTLGSSKVSHSNYSNLEISGDVCYMNQNPLQSIKVSHEHLLVLLSQVYFIIFHYLCAHVKWCIYLVNTHYVLYYE